MWKVIRYGLVKSQFKNICGEYKRANYELIGVQPLSNQIKAILKNSLWK